MKPAELLTKYRNLFLLLLLVTTLFVSGNDKRRRLEEDAATVSLPVVATTDAPPASPLESYRQQRDSAHQADVAALQALCDQEKLDQQTRQDASVRLQSLVAQHQAALAMEGALLNSSLAPCVAVVTSGSMTLVTEKAEVTEADSALVATLAAAHAGMLPSGVRIITAE